MKGNLYTNECTDTSVSQWPRLSFEPYSRRITDIFRTICFRENSIIYTFCGKERTGTASVCGSGNIILAEFAKINRKTVHMVHLSPFSCTLSSWMSLFGTVPLFCLHPVFISLFGYGHRLGVVFHLRPNISWPWKMSAGRSYCEAEGSRFRDMQMEGLECHCRALSNIVHQHTLNAVFQLCSCPLNRFLVQVKFYFKNLILPFLRSTDRLQAVQDLRCTACRCINVESA